MAIRVGTSPNACFELDPKFYNVTLGDEEHSLARRDGVLTATNPWRDSFNALADLHALGLVLPARPARATPV